MESRDGHPVGTPGHHAAAGEDTRAAAEITIGEFRIDCARHRLFQGERRLRVQSKPLDVLIHLALHHDRLVSRSELLERFWHRQVNEEALTRCISTLRKLLGDAREPPRYIETSWGRGYRIIAPVTIRPAAERMVAPRSLPTRPARGRRMAWAASVAAVLVVLFGLFALRQTGEPPAEPPTEWPAERLAVLPITAAEEDLWLAAGLSVHLQQLIARIEGVTVVTVTATEQIPPGARPRELGQLLQAGAVLSTELFREGGGFGLRAQLLSTRDDTLLWQFTVPAAAAAVEAGQVEEFAAQIARRLWANLQLRGRPAQVEGEAFRHDLRGRYYWTQRSSAGLAAAIEAYQAALALEPDYVDALVGLADAWLLMPLYAAVPPVEAMPRARAAAQRALELDREATHALAVLGVIAMQYDWRWADAEADLRRALALNPNDATAEQWLGELYCYRLRFDECRRHLAIAAGLDPLAPVLRMMQGSPALYSGDFDGAVRAYSRALEAVPEFPLSRYVLGLAHAGLSEWEQAIAHYRAALPELGLAIVGGPLVFALARHGDEGQAMALLQEIEALAAERYVPPSKLAIGWLGLGERERALGWLERAVGTRDDRLVYLAVDAHFYELHTDPAFRTLAAGVGLLDVLPAP